MTREVPEFESPTENGLIRDLRKRLRARDKELLALRQQLEQYEQQAGSLDSHAEPSTDAVEDAQAYIESVIRQQQNNALANVVGLSAAVATSSSGFGTDLAERINQTQNQGELLALMRDSGLAVE